VRPETVVDSHFYCNILFLLRQAFGLLIVAGAQNAGCTDVEGHGDDPRSE